MGDPTATRTKCGECYVYVGHDIGGPVNTYCDECPHANRVEWCYGSGAAVHAFTNEGSPDICDTCGTERVEAYR